MYFDDKGKAEERDSGNRRESGKNGKEREERGTEKMGILEVFSFPL